MMHPFCYVYVHLYCVALVCNVQAFYFVSTVLASKNSYRKLLCFNPLTKQKCPHYGLVVNAV